jgi:hypothetical protein
VQRRAGEADLTSFVCSSDSKEKKAQRGVSTERWTSWLADIPEQSTHLQTATASS